MLFNKKAAGLFIGGIFILTAAGAQSFVSPEHYEKLKMENKTKAKEAEKPQSPAQGKIQVHQPGEGASPPWASQIRNNDRIQPTSGLLRRKPVCLKTLYSIFHPSPARIHLSSGRRRFVCSG